MEGWAGLLWEDYNTIAIEKKWLAPSIRNQAFLCLHQRRQQQPAPTGTWLLCPTSKPLSQIIATNKGNLPINKKQGQSSNSRGKQMNLRKEGHRHQWRLICRNVQLQWGNTKLPCGRPTLVWPSSLILTHMFRERFRGCAWFRVSRGWGIHGWLFAIMYQVKNHSGRQSTEWQPI